MAARIGCCIINECIENCNADCKSRKEKRTGREKWREREGGKERQRERERGENGKRLES
jgi:hypothetical protein